VHCCILTKQHHQISRVAEATREQAPVIIFYLIRVGWCRCLRGVRVSGAESSNETSQRHQASKLASPTIASLLSLPTLHSIIIDSQ